MGNSTPCKIVTPENFVLKLCTCDNVGEMMLHAHFGSNRYSGGFSPNRWNITTLWLFIDCPVLTFFPRSCAQVERLNRFLRFMAQTMCFRARKCLLGFRMMGNPIWGKQAPKMGGNRQFQAKTSKYKNRNISETVNRINTKFEDQAQNDNCTSWVV